MIDDGVVEGLVVGSPQRGNSPDVVGLGGRNRKFPVETQAGLGRPPDQHLEALMEKVSGISFLDLG